MELKQISVEKHRVLAYPELWERGFFHLFTTGDMDMGYVTTKSFEKLQAQLDMLLQHFSWQPEMLYTGYQIHSARIALVKEGDEGEDYPLGRLFPDTDGILTNRHDALLMTKFADCVPILLFDPIHMAQANLHSGWKGTLQHMAPKGVQAMIQHYDTDPTQLIAILGPSIRHCHFEVEVDVALPFQVAFPNNLDKITQVSDIKYHIDLQGLIKSELLALGLNPDHIHDVNLCTHHHLQFHSYRRDGENFGLMAALSMIHQQ